MSAIAWLSLVSFTAGAIGGATGASFDTVLVALPVSIGLTMIAAPLFGDLA